MTDQPGARDTPFTLQCQSNVFSQRQALIFGDLQALEDAHQKVHSETTSERKLIEMTWKEPTPVVETLEDKNEMLGVTHHRTTQPKNSSPDFKVPIGRPRSQRRADRPAGAEGRYVRRRSSKWLHYSLADVDEDAVSDRSCANDLIHQLTQRRLEQEENRAGSKQTEHESQRRIIFRSKCGQKKPRLEAGSDSSHKTSQGCFTLPAEDEEGEINDLTKDEVSHTVFRSRRARQFARRNNLSDDEDDSGGGGENAHKIEHVERRDKSPLPGESSPPFEADDCDNSFENAPEGL